MSRRQSRRNGVAMKEEKWNEKVEMKKEKKKVRVWDLKQIDSSKGPGLGKVNRLPSWSIFIKVLLKS